MGRGRAEVGMTTTPLSGQAATTNRRKTPRHDGDGSDANVYYIEPKVVYVCELKKQSGGTFGQFRNLGGTVVNFGVWGNQRTADGGTNRGGLQSATFGH